MPEIAAAPRPPGTARRIPGLPRRPVVGWLVATLTLLGVGGAASSGTAVAAVAAAGDPGPVVVRYRPPSAAPVRVVRPFAGPAQPWAPGHRGVDLAAPVGTPVLAPAAGTVTVSGTVVDRGVVTIVHADGRRSSLEPVSPQVVVGQHVEAGQVVGTVSGERSHCAGSCLHWGVRDGQAYLDPLTLLPGAGPVVLLPDEG